MLFDRLALLGPSSLALCAALGVGCWLGEAQAQNSAPSPPETAEPLPGTAYPLSQQPPPPSPPPPPSMSGSGYPQAGYPSAQAPLYAAPSGAGHANQAYYGTYAPASNYPSAPSYTGPLGRPPGPGSHEHEGFFLRFTLGVGAAGTSYQEQIEGPHVSNVKTRGLAAAFDIAIGGRVVDNFIAHGSLSIAGVDSTREIDGVKDRSYRSLSTTLWMLGVGGTYYFMPSNLFLTLVVGTGGFVETRDYGDLDIEQEQIESGAGFATSLAVGKEWWVGGRGEWGIGGSITGSFYSVPIEVGDVKSTALGNVISLAFNATLN